MDIQQRAHINWITKGDQGTKFFAHSIKARQVKNSIIGTLDCNGRQTNSLGEMKTKAVAYFSDLYSAPAWHAPIPNLNIIFDERPSEEYNARLRRYGKLSTICRKIKL